MATRRPEQYDTLLRVRKRQEEVEALSLAAAHREVQTVERQREELSRLQRLAIENASKNAGKGKNSLRLNQYLQFQRHLARLSDDKDSVIVSLNREADERRQVLEDAMKRRKMVERLHERAWDALRQGISKEERRISDETASTQAALVQAAGRRKRRK